MSRVRGSDPGFEAKRRRWVGAGAVAGVVAAVFGLTVGDLHVAVELVAPPGRPLTPEAASLLRITGGLLGPPLVAAGWVFARGLRWSARGSESRALDAAWIAATAFAVAHAALAVTDLVLAAAIDAAAIASGADAADATASLEAAGALRGLAALAVAVSGGVLLPVLLGTWFRRLRHDVGAAASTAVVGCVLVGVAARTLAIDPASHAATAIFVQAMAGRAAAFVAMCAAWYQAARAPSREGRIASRAR
jgi:hypothetical protein